MPNGKRRELALFATCCAVMLALQACSNDPAIEIDSPSADLHWGVNGHPTTAYGSVTLDQQMSTLKRLGMQSYRVAADLKKMDEMLAAAKRHKITLLPIIHPGVDFANEQPQEIYAKSYKIGEETAHFFKGRIKVWELGNELEGFALIQPCETRDDGTKYPCEWGPAGGVAALDYVGERWAKVSAALKGMSDGVHAGDPEAKRAMGSAGWGHIGSFERMKADGINWEISVWHEYGTDPEWAMKILATYGKPIWITEFGANSVDSEDNQAKLITALMARFRSLKTYGVTAAYVYELLDEPYWTDYEGKMGLVHLKEDAPKHWVLGTDKPAAAAVQAAIVAGR